jgi:hypothetical protein
MQQRLQSEVPAFAAWLKQQEQELDLGPQPLASLALARALKGWRAVKYRLYARSTTAVA